MKNATIWGIVAGAATATAVLMTYRRSDGSRLADGLISSARQLGNKIKDRLQHNVKGPNGEAVYLDMYDRQFFEDAEGKRVYLDVH
ncbi:hypothetical protein [Desertivirga brevis]|uniref:hypothetical protein n=1 Tax=Desertivirga brevis TaxID=2810310 RepID=UPI001A96042E|nr:hypothetical protein [Pedobacter sp. SYSU D00873]